VDRVCEVLSCEIFFHNYSIVYFTIKEEDAYRQIEPWVTHPTVEIKPWTYNIKDCEKQKWRMCCSSVLWWGKWDKGYD
jgi:hypothetical protein